MAAKRSAKGERKPVYEARLRTLSAGLEPIPQLCLDDLFELAPAMCSLAVAALDLAERGACAGGREADAARLLVIDLAVIVGAAEARLDGCDVVVCEDEPPGCEGAGRALDLLELLQLRPDGQVELEMLPKLDSVRTLIAMRLESMIRSLGDSHRTEDERPEASA